MASEKATHMNLSRKKEKEKQNLSKGVRDIPWNPKGEKAVKRD